MILKRAFGRSLFDRVELVFIQGNREPNNAMQGQTKSQRIVQSHTVSNAKIYRTLQNPTESHNVIQSQSESQRV